MFTLQSLLPRFINKILQRLQLRNLRTTQWRIANDRDTISFSYALAQKSLHPFSCDFTYICLAENTFEPKCSIFDAAAIANTFLQ